MVELSDRLHTAEALLIKQGRQLKELEAAQAKDKPVDYAPYFEEIRQLLQQQPVSESSADLPAQLEALSKSMLALPKALPVEHHHHIEDSARYFALGAVGLLLITALAAGCCFSLYRQNTELAAHDLKYRLIRLYHPHLTQWADSVYERSPEKMPELVERLESRQLLIRQAAELARQKQEEAREAAQQLKRLQNAR